MNFLLKLIFIFLVIALIITIPTAIFIGVGYLISSIIPLTLFEASILCISTTFVFGFLLNGFARSARGFGLMSSDDDDEDWDDEEDWEEKENSVSDKKSKR
jgi:hypothetical protein